MDNKNLDIKTTVNEINKDINSLKDKLNNLTKTEIKDVNLDEIYDDREIEILETKE